MKRPDEPQDVHLLGTSEQLSESEQLELLVESYLDGLLSPQQAAQFERRLLEPAVADAFRESLMLRALLADMPPDQAPEELVAALEAALVTDVRLARKAARMPRLRAALSGMSWMVRGPAQAIGATGGAQGGQGDPVRHGLSTLRYALGPLATGGRSPSRSPRSWWRRALARGLRRKPKDNA